MQKNILWKSAEYNSLENCIITSTNKGFKISSTIIGIYKQEIYKVKYRITLNNKWETLFFKIKTQLNNNIKTISYKGDGKGNWLKKGKAAKKFQGCIDIDISLTAFTNTLAINRIMLSEKKEQKIKVLYVDVLGQKVKPAKQKYTRFSKNKYTYENVSNDFEAVLIIDEFGLIIEYPGLFKRIKVVENN
jgi:uncharacterized protein